MEGRRARAARAVAGARAARRRADPPAAGQRPRRGGAAPPRSGARVVTGGRAGPGHHRRTSTSTAWSATPSRWPPGSSTTARPSPPRTTCAPASASESRSLPRHPPPHRPRHVPHDGEQRPEHRRHPHFAGAAAQRAHRGVRDHIGVRENGAGVMPSSSGRSRTRAGRAGAAPRCRARASAEPGREAVEPGLGRAVDVVGPAHPDAGDRGEHHDRPAPLGPQQLGEWVSTATCAT